MISFDENNQSVQACLRINTLTKCRVMPLFTPKNIEIGLSNGYLRISTKSVVGSFLEMKCFEQHPSAITGKLL